MFFHFSSLWTPVTFKAYNFVHLKWFKILKKCFLEFYKSSLNLIATEQHIFKEFFECLRTSFVTFGGLFFWVVDPSTLGAITFSILIRFLMIFSASGGPIRGVEVLLEHQEQQSPPFGSGLPWVLKCSVTGQLTLLFPWRSMVFKIPCLTFPRDTQPVSIGHQEQKKKKNGLIIT